MQDLGFIKTAEGSFLDILAWGLKLERKPAVKTQGLIQFTRDQIGNALVVAANTVINSPPVNGRVYSLITLVDTPFPDNSLTVDVTAVAIDAGAAFNLAPGYYSVLPEALAGVVSVRNNDNWITLSGADAEKDEELQLRCRNQFTAVGQFHHDAAYKAIISEFSGLRIDYIWFEHGAPRGPGTANAYVMIDSGAPSQTFVDTINDHIINNGFHGHGDDMQVFPMPVTPVSLTADIYINPSLTNDDQDTLMAGIENMIRSAFRENQDFTVTRTLPYNRFSFSLLGQELHSQFPDLVSIEFSRQDIANVMDLPGISSLTLNKHLGGSQ